LLCRGAIGAAFLSLAGKLGYMQVVERRFYEAKAEGNSEKTKTAKAPRGLFFDAAGRLLADNRRAWAVKVVPARLPEVGTPERQRVLDQLIAELALPDVLVIDPQRIPVGQEDTVYGEISSLLGAADIPAAVEKLKARAKINYLVLLREIDPALSVDEAARYRAEARRLPGLQVINLLDYQIGNAGDPRQPILVRQDVPRETALRLENNRLFLPGVELDDSALVRKYHGGPTMSHLLGFARPITFEAMERSRDERGRTSYDPDDILGEDGLEYQLEEQLRGRKGFRVVIEDTHGVEVRELPGAQDPKPGKNFKLTIDLELQAAASDALAKGIRFSNEDRKAKYEREPHIWSEPKVKAKAGAVVAIDPRTGAVLTMVNFPHYDNQLFVDGISQRTYDEYADPERGYALFNRAIAGNFPPGSSIKPFMAAAALHAGKISQGTTFNCTGCIKVPFDWDESKGNEHPCWNHDGHGPLDVFSAIAQSCDVFFYNVGAPKDKAEGADEYLRYYDYDLASRTSGERHFFGGLGIERMHDILNDKFWFGSRTGIELPGEYQGVVPNLAWLEKTYPGQGWSVGDTINASIGQGYFAATPLQMALNTAAIANRGTIHRPTLLLEEVDSQGKKIESLRTEPRRKVEIDREHLDAVREGMRRVIHEREGSAHHAYDLDFNEIPKWPLTNPKGEEEIRIGGKSGTAETGDVDPETGKYTRQHCWFTAFAPYDDPEITLAVVIEDGGEGSAYAVPVVDRVLRAYFELTGRRQRGRKDSVLREDKQPISPHDDERSGQDGLPAPGETITESQD
jgi:penicillin-binding protein 2